MPVQVKVSTRGGGKFKRHLAEQARRMKVFPLVVEVGFKDARMAVLAQQLARLPQLSGDFDEFSALRRTQCFVFVDPYLHISL